MLNGCFFESLTEVLLLWLSLRTGNFGVGTELSIRNESYNKLEGDFSHLVNPSRFLRSFTAVYGCVLCSGDKDCKSFLFNGETKQIQLLTTIENPVGPPGNVNNWRYFIKKIEPRVCEAGWEKFGESCYLFSLSYGTWNNGKTFCEGEEGYLVEITSLEEDTFIRDYVRNRGLTAIETRDSWIGATDVAVEGSFVWSESGQPITYNNYGPNNPDNSGGNQHCLILYQPSDYKWHDTQCTNQNSFICEK